MRRATPDHGMGFGRVRMGQQGQRPLGREALPGPAGARQGGVRRGQHGVLAVVAAQVLAARAVGLHHHPAAQFGVALGDAHAVGVLLQDPGGRSRQQGHAALGDAGFEPGVEARIADHAAQLRHVEVGMADQAAAQAAALRVYGCCGCRPSVPARRPAIRGSTRLPWFMASTRGSAAGAASAVEAGAVPAAARCGPDPAPPEPASGPGRGRRAGAENRNVEGGSSHVRKFNRPLQSPAGGVRSHATGAMT